MTSTAHSPGPATSQRSPGSGALGRRSAVSNLVAQGMALGIVSLASLLVARLAGAAVLGEYTLLRVLPWLLGVVTSCGLPIASSYFLGARGGDRALRPTMSMIALVSAVLTFGIWTALTPALHRLLFDEMPPELLLIIGVTGVTQLCTVWAKACCQGSADLRGANLIIVCEELMFLPAYGLALATGLRGIHAVVVGMVSGGIAASLIALGRLLRSGFFRDWGRPSARLARTITGYGARGQLGNLLWLVNLRLDFIILGAMAGPAVLGVYAVASKFAELMRLPATAVNYVLYPRFTRQEARQAWLDACRLLKRGCLLTAAGTPVIAGLSVVTIPLLFGSQFRGAIVPACLLLVGLAVEGAAAVSSAYLWGAGRPGTNSVGMALGVVLTVVFDLLLIPTHGALGAAVASSIAYIGTAALLSFLTFRSGRRLPGRTSARNGVPA